MSRPVCSKRGFESPEALQDTEHENHRSTGESPAEPPPLAGWPPRPDLSGHRLGAYSSGREGPRFVLVGGLHGNEPAGVRAILEILHTLEERELPLRGEILGLAGNLAALRHGDRFIDRDLNRMWSREEIGSPLSAEECHEVGERADLLELIEEAIGDATEPVVFVDLHSTSAAGAPFSIIGDTLQNRRIAFSYPVPVILGMEENVEGALLGYFGERGHIAVGFEGGKHDDPLTVRHHVAAIWLTLIAAGALRYRDLPEAVEVYSQLAAAGRGLPGVIETRYRHHVEERDRFTMCGGFGNFDQVESGELLARDRDGPVHAPEAGRLLLPLYQGKGQDGFFLGREVRRFWLRFSTALRKLRLARVVHWLPGVHRVEGEIGTIEVTPVLDRCGARAILHLLGFRRCLSVERHLRFSRRVEGFRFSGPGPGIRRP